MSAEWPLVAVEEVCDLIVDCVNKTAPVSLSATSFRMIRTTNVRNGRIDLADCRYVDQETYEKWTRRARLQFGDVILTREAPIGEVGFVKEYEGVFLGQRLMQYRANPEVLDARFLLYSFLSPELQNQFGSHEGSGSVVSHIRVGDCFKFKLRLPPLREQKSIAALLGALDDRIALLRETNATLEAMAQALFKSWFVDFDPVHANAGTRAATLPAELQALFPSAFTDTPQGLVPDRWQVGVVGDVAQQKKGSINPMQAPERLFEHYSLPAFDSNQVPVLEQGEKIKSNKTPLPPNAVLLSKLNPHIPRVWLPFGYSASAVCSTEFLVYSPINSASKEFIYSLFTSVNFLMNLQQLVTGTSNSHQRVKPDHVVGLELVIPSQDILAEFESAVKPLFERIGHNRQQVQTLVTLRDTLLPRLISGQLRLPDAEAALAEAGA